MPESAIDKLSAYQEGIKISEFDAVIIGGGFYGLRIALFLYDEMGIKNIAILEKEKQAMTHASYANQARVHNGYHYPRSTLTAYRSAVNFPRFINEYSESIDSEFTKFYGIARHLSKVNANQFKRFCEKIGSEVEPASKEITALFDPTYVEQIFKVKEYAFDAVKLRTILLDKIKQCPGITIHNGEEVERIDSENGSLKVVTQTGDYHAAKVLNCTYSNINALHRRSGLPLVAFKHEITEMCLVKMPEKLKDISVTMMDGPFFSFMPFPSRQLYTLSHVRYTPHESWLDNGQTPQEKRNPHSYLASRPFTSNYKQMYNDVVRFMPALKDMRYVDSLVEVKTVLVKSEDDDSRPILYRDDFGIDGYVCIMGGKVDNIYDVFEELKKTYAK